jgi:endonuclease/exonuclease/phosphatase (EEP) superfamily protein YafD
MTALLQELQTKCKNFLPRQTRTLKQKLDHIFKNNDNMVSDIKLCINVQVKFMILI